MKNIRVAYNNSNSKVSAQALRKVWDNRTHLVPVMHVKKNRRYPSRLDEGILVNQHTGEIFLNTPALEMHFPMLVVRHGQTDGNVKRTFQGQIDGPENQLNHTGRSQVQNAAKRLYGELTEFLGPHLKEFVLSGRLMILTSPLTRAQDTANAFRTYFERQTGIPLISVVEKDLAEMYFGAIEGLSVDDIKDKELKELTERFRNNQDAIIDWKGTGESFFDVVTRANNLLERLNTQYRQQDVLIISFAHGTLINALRVAVGDKTLVEDDGLIAFRKHHVDNAQAVWLGRSQQLAEQLFERVIQKSA